MKDRIISWVVPTLLTGLIAVFAGGVQLSLKTNQQNTEMLLNELNKVRVERQKLNDELFNVKQENKQETKAPN